MGKTRGVARSPASPANSSSVPSGSPMNPHSSRSEGWETLPSPSPPNACHPEPVFMPFENGVRDLLFVFLLAVAPLFAQRREGNSFLCSARRPWRASLPCFFSPQVPLDKRACRSMSPIAQQNGQHLQDQYAKRIGESCANQDNGFIPGVFEKTIVLWRPFCRFEARASLADRPQ